MSYFSNKTSMVYLLNKLAKNISQAMVVENEMASQANDVEQWVNELNDFSLIYGVQLASSEVFIVFAVCALAPNKLKTIFALPIHDVIQWVMFKHNYYIL
ncbi:ethylene-responsive transcription factor [Trifolium repens]|nr:ethylene-responsive transcription factor [Trifolium repens]